MGAGMSNPIDSDKHSKIEKATTDVLTPFAKAYPRHYMRALFAKVKGDLLAEKGDDESPFELLKEPEDDKPEPQPHMMGYLTKEGAIRKSWKKRYFVVRPDYKVEYYENENVYKNGGKPKGVISPSGYKVVTDLGSEMMEKAKSVAEALKIDISELPKPKQYPEFTFGVMHDRRRNYFITAENEESFQSWVDMFKLCCRRAEGLINQEEVAKSAYESAFEQTRLDNGYSLIHFDGTEVENLSDLIFRNVSREVLDDVFGGLDAPAKFRSTIMEKVEDGVGSFINTTVNVAWSAASSGVESTRNTVEEKVKSNCQPIIDAENELTEKAKAKISDKINPAVEKHVAPKLGAVLPVLIKPLVAAFEKAFEVFSSFAETAEKEAEASGALSAVKTMRRNVTKTSSLAPCFTLIDLMSEGLSKVDAIPQLANASVIADVLVEGKDAIESLMSMAAYTTKKLTEDAEKEGKEKSSAVAEVKAEVMKRFKHDAQIKVGEAIKNMLMNVVKPPVDEDVAAPCKEALAPLSESIPEVAKDFIDIDAKLDDIIESTIGGAIDSAVDGQVPEFK